MIEHQIHFKRKFYQDKKRGYWISTDNPRIRAHIWVWNNIHGKIPPGYHIHHKDEDKSNNSINNLELIERSRHLRDHMLDPERRKKASECANKYRHLTKAWHASEEGRAWHKLHAIKCKFGKWEAKKYNCKNCTKEFESVKISRADFCSNNCKSIWRRKSGVDDIDKICPTCQKTFRSNKYSKQTFCTRTCSSGRNRYTKSIS